jgi:hypothetical protein
MFQFVLTPAAGKRLIGKAAAVHPKVQAALNSGTVVVIAGTTNGYVAEELLISLGETEKFDRSRFYRGITLPPLSTLSDAGTLPDEGEFPGDVVLVDGSWQKGKTIFDVADQLKEGDVIMKGANAVNLLDRRAGVLIGHPKGGTTSALMQAVAGRRVHLLVPVGVEKRIPGDVDAIALKLNAPGAKGPRFFPIPGEILTELEAITLLTGAAAEISAAGGVGGAEGSVWVTVAGDSRQEQDAADLLESVCEEEPFSV